MKLHRESPKYLSRRSPVAPAGTKKNMKESYRAVLISIILLLNITESWGQTESNRYELPAIPFMIEGEEARIDFIAEHYWDNFNFSDTTLTHKPKYTEQAFANYLDYLRHVSLAKAQSSIRGLMSSASVNKTMFSYFNQAMENYLYNPNSPVRNEDFYIPVLEYLIASDSLSDIEKTRPRHRLEMAMKNRPGNKAADFIYTLKDGTQHSLYDIKSEYTILFFNHPDCQGCKLVKEQIAGAQFFSQLADRLTILAVYPNEDDDLELWRQTDYPDCMINSYDKTTVIFKNNTYDLKASPTLYLLDKDKKVILKDTSLNDIASYLSNL